MKTTTLEGRGFVTAVIRSIGARHDGAHDLVTDGLYVDLRRALRNPADDPTMRYRTGLDGDVYEHARLLLGLCSHRGGPLLKISGARHRQHTRLSP